ncbi:MAG TPA: glycosyltransferase, partial [Gemmatimonadaceae bacterium]|nr:glycosyltransferase [Gemmatimonadaceae bacterium]
VRILLVGRDMVETNQELNDLIQQSGHPDRFVLLGERNDVAGCLSAMDIFCQPSRSEAFPTALGEAMAVGLPCVATDVGDSALLIGDAGTLVPREDPVALAAALERLVNTTAAERHELGARARKRIGENFSIDQIRRRYEDVYTKTAAGTLFEDRSR